MNTLRNNPARKTEFVCEEHKEYASNGWRPKNQPNFDPYGGMATAHDCLEHFPDSTDSAEDEFMALGAAMFVRGEAGYWHKKSQRNNSPGSNIAADIPDILRHALDGDSSYDMNPPKTKPLAEHVEQWIDVALKEGYDECKAQWEGDENSLSQIREMLKPVRAWLRIGYRRAVKRFKPLGLHGRDGAAEACDLFMQIEKEADKILNDAAVGDELHVKVDITNRKVVLAYLDAYALHPEYADDY